MKEYKTFQLATAPSFSNKQIQDCREADDFLPLFFEIQQKTMVAVITCAQLRPEESEIKNIPQIHFAVLVGLLNRCSRLTLAVNNLGSEGLFGETTRLLMRSIVESSIKARWLMNGDEDRFKRFFCDGLKNEAIMRGTVRGNIEARGGESLVIEDRMLSFSQRFFDLPSLTEEEVNDCKRLPNLDSMCRDLGLNDLTYISVQRIGSHSVHGTWPDLCTYYLRFVNGDFHVEDHNARISENELLSSCDFMLTAAGAFLRYIERADGDLDDACKTLSDYRALIEICHGMLDYRDDREFSNKWLEGNGCGLI